MTVLIGIRASFHVTVHGGGRVEDHLDDVMDELVRLAEANCGIHDPRPRRKCGLHWSRVDLQRKTLRVVET